MLNLMRRNIAKRGAECKQVKINVRLRHLVAKPEPNVKPDNLIKRCVFQGHTSMPMFEMESKPVIPLLGHGEVLGKVRCATICLSDIHTVCGHRIEPTPSVLGHEACVEIVEHRRDNSQLKMGDRVTFSLIDSCGECEFCLNDLSQKCTNLFKYGHSAIHDGSGFNGCYSTHIVIRKGTRVIKLPDEIGDDLAATINCALATMVNCVEQIPVSVKKPNSRVLIQGDGMLGLYGCVLLKELGIRHVYCSGMKVIRSNLIKSFGAIPVNHDDISQLKDQQNKFDCVIEACGNAEAIPTGISLLKPGGAYMLVGMVHPKTALNNLTGEQIIRKCLTLKGIHNYQGRHLESAVDFLKTTVHKYPYGRTIAPKIFSLDQLPNAIDFAKKKLYPRVCVRP